jgi:hypothetical protein
MEINLFQAAVYLATGLLIFILFRIANTWLQKLLVRKNWLKIPLRILPVAEIIVWLLFLRWLTTGLFLRPESSLAFNMIFSAILLVLFAWFFMRDYMAGIILKTENIFSPGQKIKTADVSGKIIKAGYRALEIESESGRFSKIPYSLLALQVFSLQAPDETVHSHEVVLNLAVTSGIEDVNEQIVRELLLLPWVSVNQKPVITIIEENHKGVSLKVSYQAASDSQAHSINQYLRKRFENQ